MGRLWRAPLAAHVAVSAVVFLGALLFSGTQGVVSFDEGAYGAQARALADRGWAVDYRFASVDPDAKWFPDELAERGPNGTFHYARQPLYPVILAAAALIAPGMMFVTSALGGWMAAIAAAALVRRAGPDAMRLALWIAGFSTLLVNGVLLWGHALLCAVAGWALVGLVEAARERRSARMFALGAGASVLVGVAVLLRAEGLLVAGAATVAWIVAGLTGVLPRRWPAVAASLVAGSALAHVVTTRWAASITGGSYAVSSRTEGSSLIEGRVSGAWDVLLAPSARSAGLVVCGLVVVGVGVCLGVQLGRGTRPPTRWLVSAGVLVLVFSVAQMGVSGGELVPGLLVAWPFGAVAVGLVVTRLTCGEDRLLVVFLGAFGVAVLATQYANGGGMQWGGRYLSPVCVPLAALAASVVVREQLSIPRLARIVFALTLVVPSLLGVILVRDIRADNEAIVVAVAEASAPVVVTDMPWYARASWEHPELRWALTRGEDPVGVADRLSAHYGVEVSVLRSQPGAMPLGAKDVTPPALSDLGVQLLTLSATP
jgi:hypothetical protein